MRRAIPVLLIVGGMIFAGAPAAAGDPTGGRFHLAAAFVNQWKNDSDFRSVYGNSWIGVNLEAGYRLRPGFWIGVSAALMKDTGRTILFQEQTTLRQTPVFGFVRAAAGRRLRAMLAVGAGCIIFRESSYMGQTSGSPWAWMAEAGAEYDISGRFFAAAAVRYIHCRWRAPVLEIDQQIGGTDLRAGAGIRF